MTCSIATVIGSDSIFLHANPSKWLKPIVASEYVLYDDANAVSNRCVVAEQDQK